MRKVALFFETTTSNDRNMLRGVAKYSLLRGPWLLDCKFHPFYVKGRNIWNKVINELKSWQPEGIIAHVDPKKSKDLLELNTPTVLGILTEPEYQEVPYFADDNKRIGNMAAEHLVGLGFKHFGFCGFNNFFWSQQRCESFKQTIESNGFEVNIYQPPSNRFRSLLRDERFAVSKWLQSLPKPAAVMACNDVRGQQVIDSCRLVNFSVPEEVAVLGVDNDDLICDTTSPPLSSIALDSYDAGYKVAKLLDEMMTKKKIVRKIIPVHPTHVVTRQSSDILAIEDQEVAKAIRFIRINAKLNTTVDEVVDQTTLARRALEQRFKKTIHRTISNEIKRVCIERISKMLRETNMPVYKIAADLGSYNSEHLARTFRKETGMSPREYRIKQST